jgi:hypothetical protein
MGTEWTACDRCGATLVYSESWAAYFHYPERTNSG